MFSSRMFPLMSQNTEVRPVGILRVIMLFPPFLFRADQPGGESVKFFLAEALYCWFKLVDAHCSGG